jgi:hypothetical protein
LLDQQQILAFTVQVVPRAFAVRPMPLSQGVDCVGSLASLWTVALQLIDGEPKQVSFIVRI